MVIDSHRSGYKALRRGRISEPGRLYLLTTVTLHRQPRFAEWACASIAASVVSSPENWPQARLLCWVLMPDHWHELVELVGDMPLEQLVNGVKGKSAHAVNRVLNRSGSVWMPAFMIMPCARKMMC